jgi:hypothetical protein
MESAKDAWRKNPTTERIVPLCLGEEHSSGRDDDCPPPIITTENKIKKNRMLSNMSANNHPPRRDVSLVYRYLLNGCRCPLSHSHNYVRSYVHSESFASEVVTHGDPAAAHLRRI